MAIIDDFQKLDIRVGKIINVDDCPEVKKPVFKLQIDFGDEIGIKMSCVGVKHNYTKENLIGKLILGIVNLPPRKMGPEISEILTLGVSDKNGNCVLIQPEREVEISSKLF
ncbi:MAG: tRNA-binding protein [Patescibacteria group bacterium]